MIYRSYRSERVTGLNCGYDSTTHKFPRRVGRQVHFAEHRHCGRGGRQDGVSSGARLLVPLRVAAPPEPSAALFARVLRHHAALPQKVPVQVLVVLVVATAHVRTRPSAGTCRDAHTSRAKTRGGQKEKKTKQKKKNN